MTELMSLTGRLTMSSVCGLEQVGDNQFRSVAMYLADGSADAGRLFGGQVAAAALLSAGLTTGDRLPHSLHGYFLRPGRTDRPVTFRVERARDGRVYTARRVSAYQDDREIFAMAASFSAPVEESGHVGMSLPARPDVPEPHDCEPLRVEPEIALEIRLCKRPTRAQYFPTLFWARHHQLDGNDFLAHAAAITYLSDFSTGLSRQHGRWTLGSSVDHALWLHRSFLWHDWVLVELTAGVVDHMRGQYTGAITDRLGRPVASFGQEMVYRSDHETA